MTEDNRIRRLNDNQISDGKYVLYWMQQSQRVPYNQSLLRASFWSLNLDLPLIVYFGLTDDYPDANARHYAFMLQGLEQVKNELAHLGIGFMMRHISPEKGAVELSRDSAITICDMGYLRHQKKWRDHVAGNIRCPMEMVENDVIVPVETAYNKEAYSAAVLRPKIKKHLNDHLIIPEEIWPEKDSTDIDLDYVDFLEPKNALGEMDIDMSVQPVDDFKGGEVEADRRLEKFLDSMIDDYGERRNDPSLGIQSNLSPFLHFGQISPLYIALKAMDSDSPGADDFLEELIIRRELAMNFTYYNPAYDSFKCLPKWSRESLAIHSSDPREYVYTLKDLESAKTHDPYWNAAQNEMVKTGKMHNYMRMYWGKKIIEWSVNPKESFDTAIYLNNRFSLDGRDPNSFAGVAWCFGKHDRAWTERPIFGKVRYMNDRGLERKFDMEPYLKRFGG